MIRSGSRQVRWSGCEDCVKARLLEVSIGGQGFPNAFPFHNNEREAVRQAPVFV